MRTSKVRRGPARRVAADLAARYGDLLLPVQIRETVRAAEAPARHLPLIAASPDAAAEDYRQLARLLLSGERFPDRHPAPTPGEFAHPFQKSR